MPSHLAFNPLNAQSLITGLGIFAAMFAETGLLIGFFLPSDSLLFTAGILAATSTTNPTHLPLIPVMLAAAAGTILGAHTGYLIGRRGGPTLLRRSQHLRNGVQRAATLIDRYGHGKTIVMARFIPVVRTVLNPLAGTIGAPLKPFTRWQILGSLIWTVGWCETGYLIGNSVPNIDRYLLSVVAVLVAVSLIPLAIETHRARGTSTRNTSHPATKPSREG